jgi:FlaA1/EpsC-like NDP-sugar epimerase
MLLDQDETGIFNILGELRKKFSRASIQPLVADIKDEKKIQHIFDFYKPQIVFHAAAYKHVPLMEEHADEAVKNNIFGTEVLAKTSAQSGVEKFIFISTDKAVNPTSVMGATKRICEMVCQTYNQQYKTQFMSVRFGNVLNSRGSVIPIFKEQIRRGGPVEVTHKDMQRYFMLTSEACLLVMQAGAIGQGGEVFVLDMGKPVKIVDLAREMIKLSGFKPDTDIPIVFTGIRPGEKLFEEILTAEEGVSSTHNQKIFTAKPSEINPVFFKEKIDSLRAISFAKNHKDIKAVFKELIPFYTA